MEIFDENGVLIESPDLNKGWLENQQRVIAHHPATEKIPEESHSELLQGTDDLWSLVVDQPYVPAKPAWDETETYQIYHPYTPEQLAERSRPTQEQRLTAVENALLELMLGGEPLV